MDGFDLRGNVKVIVVINRFDIFDLVLFRLGRFDRFIEVLFLDY